MRSRGDLEAIASAAEALLAQIDMFGVSDIVGTTDTALVEALRAALESGDVEK